MNNIKEILIIDDCDSKRDNIKRYMRNIFPNAAIYEGKCVHDGLYTVHNNRMQIFKNPEEYLIILDMMMPFYKNERIETDGGAQIIREMQRLKLQCPVIIASSETTTTDNIAYKNCLGIVKEDSSIHSQPYYEELLAKLK